MFSVSSTACAVAFSSVVLGLVCVIRTFFPKSLNRGGTSILLLMAAVATFRLFLAVELPSTRLIRSWNLMGVPVRIIRTYPVVFNFLPLIWRIGVAGILVYDAFSLFRAYITSKCYRRHEDERTAKIARDLGIRWKVVVSPDVPVPYAGGVFTRSIYLPVLELPDEEIGFNLRHEAQHIRNGDLWIKFFFRIAVVVMWWNPIAHWFWYVLDDLLEVRCDTAMTKHMDTEERLAYRDMLDGLKSVLTGKERLSSLAVDELFKGSRNRFLDQRLTIIADGTGKSPRWAITVVGCALAVLFCASYLVIVQPAGMPPVESFGQGPEIYYDDGYEDFELNEGVNGAFIIKDSDGRYQLFGNYRFIKYISDDEITSVKYQHLQIFEEDV